MKEVPLLASREAHMALDNLEQMHPQYLAELLETGRLKDVLESRVQCHFQTLEKLQKAYPEEPLMNLLEMALPASLAAVNENWQGEEPLNREQNRKLAEFRETMMGEGE
jgi:hypothetical protein